LAFTTIPGGSLADIILLGSEAADTVVLNTSQSIVANGFGGSDSITIANPVAATGGNLSTFTAPTTIYGGEGNDQLLLGVYTVGSSAILGGAGNDFFGTNTATGTLNDELFFRFDYQAAEANGNEGEDTFGTNLRGIQANGSQILGGANNDTIFVGTSTNSEINGNKNLDRINVVGGSTFTGGSIFGGKGIDFLTLGASTFVGTSVDGADGNDVITANGSIVAASSTLTIVGGEGVDNITTALAGTGKALIAGATGDDIITVNAGNITAANQTINGGEGNDQITGYGSINGGAGADTITIANGSANLLYAMSSIATETGITTSTIDTISGFVVANDSFKTGVAGSATNFSAAVDAVANFSAGLNAANLFFTGAGNEKFQYYVAKTNDLGTTGFVFFKDTTTAAGATASLQFTSDAALTALDFIA